MSFLPAAKNNPALAISQLNCRETTEGSMNSDWLTPLLDLDEVRISYDRRARILWQFFRPTGRPSFTEGLLGDLRRVKESVRRAFLEPAAAADGPVRFMIAASDIDGVFNLGGNLPLFVDLIRRRDRTGLRRYAYACIDLIHDHANGLSLPIHNIALVQGDALGGGFESALSQETIIAERQARFGLPEVLFNMFPGMGAYTLLSRRINPNEAEKVILSGRVYSADEMHAMGLVDIVVDEGEGEAALYDYIARYERQASARRAVMSARRVARPVAKEELIAITEIWIDTAMGLDPADIRRMERLAAAQDRRHAARPGDRHDSAPMAAAE
ncbi:crotonase/enoyl-CoA hydratase family protein [Fodinicurvata sp. EGI_FJ10296]|uniref:crotonase/enoyl-CoA hydratase family protein n=1 Tax=Fodinicurvata sp. EGI_FJ10296 TaxID=3231908 RepID=UPI003455A157